MKLLTQFGTNRRGKENRKLFKRRPEKKANEGEKKVQQKQLLMAEDQCTKILNVNAPVWV